MEVVCRGAFFCWRLVFFTLLTFPWVMTPPPHPVVASTRRRSKNLLLLACRSNSLVVGHRERELAVAERIIPPQKHDVSAPQLLAAVCTSDSPQRALPAASTSIQGHTPCTPSFSGG